MASSSTFSTSSTIKCLLCQGSISLGQGNLDKFKHHLEAAHEALHDQDLIVAVSFLESEEKERIVETVFPRIKKFFQEIKTRGDTETPRQGLDKRLLEEDETRSLTSVYGGHNPSKRRKLEPASKYESLTESDAYDSELGSNISAEEEETNTDEASKTLEKLPNPQESKCDICEKVMLKKSIRKHKQRVHQLYESLKNMASEGFGENESITADDTTDTNDLSIDTSVLEPQVDIDVNPNHATCGICFTKISKRNLRRHMKTMHKDHEQTDEAAAVTYEDPNETKEDYETNPEDDNTEDERENIGTLEYNCDQCDAKYTRQDSLRRHKRNKH